MVYGLLTISYNRTISHRCEVQPWVFPPCRWQVCPTVQDKDDQDGASVQQDLLLSHGVSWCQGNDTCKICNWMCSAVPNGWKTLQPFSLHKGWSHCWKLFSLVLKTQSFAIEINVLRHWHTSMKNQVTYTTRDTLHSWCAVCDYALITVGISNPIQYIGYKILKWISPESLAFNLY